MSGEALKKVPRGFDPDHPHAEDLKRKDFGVHVPLSDRALTGPELLDAIDAGFRESAPLLRFICDAVGMPF
jgi:uncharacterized protein (DUF2461 family)